MTEWGRLKDEWLSDWMNEWVNEWLNEEVSGLVGEWMSDWTSDWSFYTLSASKAIFRSITYIPNLFSPVMMITWWIKLGGNLLQAWVMVSVPAYCACVCACVCAGCREWGVTCIDLSVLLARQTQPPPWSRSGTCALSSRGRSHQLGEAIVGD